MHSTINTSFMKIDENGYGVEEVLVEIQIDEMGEIVSELPPNLVKTNSKALYLPRWDFDKEEWYEGDISRALFEVKRMKEEELDRSCNEYILAGFYYTVNDIEYHFPFEMETQINYQGDERLLFEGLIDSALWTVRQEDRYVKLEVDRALMSELSLAIKEHKSNNIAKLREFLIPIVQDSTSIEEVVTIQW